MCESSTYIICQITESRTVYGMILYTTLMYLLNDFCFNKYNQYLNQPIIKFQITES